MPKFLVHVGPHKTGSTYLQKNLMMLRPQLLSRGIAFPAQWDAGRDFPSQLKLFKLLNDLDPSLEGEFEALRNSPCDVVLLSSEDFIHLTPESLSYFKSLLGDCPAEVVFYCRDWGALARSLWQEEVKHGSHETFPESFANAFLFKSGTPVFDIGTVLERLEATFGLGNIRLVSYDEVIEQKIDLFTHFAATFLQWPDAAPADSRYINQSLDPVITEFIRAFNAFSVRENSAPGPTMRQAFMAKAGALDLKGMAGRMKRAMRKLDINSASANFRAAHRRLFKKYGPCLVDPRPKDWLFPPRTTVAEYVGSDYLLEPRAVEELEDLYRSVNRT